MAVFRYEGIRSKGGNRIQGILDADSERDARRLLKHRDVYPTKLEKLESEISSRKTNRWRLFAGDRRPSMRERIVFTRQMASLLAAGFPIIEVLSTVEHQIRMGPFREVIASIRNSVGEGRSLSEALAQYPTVFPPRYISLIRAGEQGGGGALDQVLERLAVVMEEERRIKSRLLSAMIYPSVMTIVGGVVLIFLIGIIIPKVTIVFKDAHQVLPLATRSLLAVSHFLREWGWFAMIGCAVTFVSLAKLAGSTTKRHYLEKLLFKIPLINKLLLKTTTMRLCQSLGLLLGSGVPMLTGLQVTAETMGFNLIRSSVLDVARAVEQGHSLASSMAQTGHFQDLAIRMIHAGEQGGNLEFMLDRITVSYREDIEYTLDRLMQLVEPVIILVMGSVVGYVVVAVLLPIFEMNQFIR
ncbi:MAG: type II secretion system F family protein [Magnetococcales bacterium]|nr:type II secretion system F family protein [Magnetococcales bacterium]MBF0151608.1 type II secretion system F family protein [Magnetococcales bacterium]MBF0631730.1 type II secretion system F family protein [Magnetococcales bacterium]